MLESLTDPQNYPVSVGWLVLIDEICSQCSNIALEYENIAPFQCIL